MDRRENESLEQYSQRLHETTWRRADRTRVLLKDMGDGELSMVIDNLNARIAAEEDKLLNDPKYEDIAQSTRANQLINNSKDKLIYLNQELDSRK